MKTMTRRFLMSLEQFMAGAEDYEGICLKCGSTQSGVEPDAHGYECESCGARAVMGFEDAMLSGYIVIKGDD